MLLLNYTNSYICLKDHSSVKCADLSTQSLRCIKCIIRHTTPAEAFLSLQNLHQQRNLEASEKLHSHDIHIHHSFVGSTVNYGICNLNQIWSSLSRIVSFPLYNVPLVQTSKLAWIDPKPLSASGLAFHFPGGCGSWIAAHQIFKEQIMWGWLSLLSAWVRRLKKSSSSSLAVFSKAKPCDCPAKLNKLSTLYC